MDIERTEPLNNTSHIDGGWTARTEAVLGADGVAALGRTKVAIFGLGGVGGWCAEALARSGVGRLMLVDSDRVAESNINRQLMATTRTVGRVKTEVLSERLQEINPAIELDVRPVRYDASTASNFPLEEYDYVIDAIDSLDAKVALIRHALSIPSVTLFSSMGAALRSDPLMIRASDFRKVEGDGLAKALRTRFKKSGGMPERHFTCVWSPERRQTRVPGALGSLVQVTAVFGMTLAALVVRDIESRLVAG